MIAFEPLAADATENFLRNFVRPGHIVLDIGANIGQSALVAAELTGPSGRVISFEPNPAAFKGLAAAVQASRHTNITLVQQALSDRAGTFDFFLDTREEYTGVASSLRELDDLAAAGKSCKSSVECITLDYYCITRSLTPDIIKIDVESAEPLVIAGGRGTIECRRPIMLFEFWETWWNLGFRELFEYLKPLYHLIRMQDGEDVADFYYTQTGNRAVDILCIPR
jgi:FkbM family methyltransferase